MKLEGNLLRLSATDLSNHLGCRHATQLDRALAEGRLTSVEWRDPNLQVLAQRGLEHERSYLDHLRSKGLNVVELPSELRREAALSQTLEAMRTGEARRRVSIDRPATAPCSYRARMAK